MQRNVLVSLVLSVLLTLYWLNLLQKDLAHSECWGNFLSACCVDFKFHLDLCGSSPKACCTCPNPTNFHTPITACSFSMFDLALWRKYVKPSL